MNYNNFIKKSFGAAILIAVMLPLLVLAQPADTPGKKEIDFCTLLSAISSRIDQNITDRETKLETKRAELQDRVQTKRTEKDAKLLQKRQKWDTNRAEHFAQIENKAQTDAQKQALLMLKQAVQAAIAARRSAIDGAIQSFRQAVNETANSRKAALDGLTNTFRTSVRAALQKANTDCTAGTIPKTVREMLKNAVQAAKQKFITDRQGLEKFKADMEELIAFRKDAIKKAIDDFKAAIEKTRDDFKTAVAPAAPQTPETPEVPEQEE